jgi:hypothetical protein
LGVPGRRYSLGGFTGAFRFLGWVNLQPYILVALPNTVPPSSAKEFVLEQPKGLVGLFGPYVIQPDRPCHQVGQLQTGQVGFLVSKDDVEWQLSVARVFAIADASELQLKFGVFLLASALDHDMCLKVILRLFCQKFP